MLVVLFLDCHHENEAGTLHVRPTRPLQTNLSLTALYIIYNISSYNIEICHSDGSSSLKMCKL